MSQKYGPLSDDDYLMSVSERERDEEDYVREAESADDSFQDEEQPPATSTLASSGGGMGLLTNDQISLLIDDIEEDAGATKSRRNLFEKDDDDAAKTEDGTQDDPESSQSVNPRKSEYPYNKERVLVVQASPVDGDDPDKPSILSRAFWERHRWQAIALVGLVAGLVAAILTSVLTHHHGGSSAVATPVAPQAQSPTKSPTTDSSVVMSEATDATVVAEHTDTGEDTLPTPASSFHPFETTTELYSAVDLYIQDTSEHTATAKRYGYPIGTWDVSRLTDFSRVFEASTLSGQPGRNPQMSNFNEDVSGWDVRGATTMYGMFQGATEFNQPVGSWSVSSVTDMKHMFPMAAKFDQPLNTWDVSNAKLDYMFYEASSFNQDISDWHVSHPAKGILYGATLFTQNLCPWGERIQASTEFSADSFVNTACPLEGEPDLTATPAGPFCHACS